MVRTAVAGTTKKRKRSTSQGDGRGKQTYLSPPSRSLGGTSNNIVHTFIRRVHKSPFPQSTGGIVSTAYAFSLADLSGYTEFTNLFDQYRITKIAMAFIPQSNAIPLSSSPGGLLTTAIDYDDNTALGNEGAILQYESAVSTPVYSSNRRTFRPRIAVAAYSGAFTSYANMDAKTWLDAASASVLYYGLKAIISQANPSSTVAQFDVVCTYTIQCRNTR